MVEMVKMVEIVEMVVMDAMVKLGFSWAELGNTHFIGKLMYY